MNGAGTGNLRTRSITTGPGPKAPPRPAESLKDAFTGGGLVNMNSILVHPTSNPSAFVCLPVRGHGWNSVLLCSVLAGESHTRGARTACHTLVRRCEDPQAREEAKAAARKIGAHPCGMEIDGE